MSDLTPPGPPPVADDKPPNQEMSGAAIGAAILALCCPLLWPVAIGLAITVLVRSTGGRDYGRVPAIIALVVCFVELVALGAWVLIASLQGVA